MLSYWVSPMLAQSVCLHFPHRSHITVESVSLTSLPHILQEYSERDMGMAIKFYWSEVMWMTNGCQFYPISYEIDHWCSFTTTIITTICIYCSYLD